MAEGAFHVPGWKPIFLPFGASLRDCGAILSPFRQSVAHFCTLSGVWKPISGHIFFNESHKLVHWAYLKGCEAIVGLSRGLVAYVWAIYGLSGC